jgi:hypothetical protein
MSRTTAPARATQLYGLLWLELEPGGAHGGVLFSGAGNDRAGAARRARAAAEVRAHWRFAARDARAFALEPDDGAQQPAWSPPPGLHTEEGVFRLRRDDLFETDLVVVWRRAFAHTALALLLEPEESVAAAVALLGLLPELLAAASRVCSSPVPLRQQQRRQQDETHRSWPEASIRTCPDVVQAVAHFFMPGGMLLTLMPDAADQLCSEMIESLRVSSITPTADPGPGPGPDPAGVAL